MSRKPANRTLQNCETVVRNHTFCYPKPLKIRRHLTYTETSLPTRERCKKEKQKCSKLREGCSKIDFARKTNNQHRHLKSRQKLGAGGGRGGKRDERRKNEIA